MFAAWLAVSALVSDRPAASLLGQYPTGTGALFSIGLVGAWAMGRAPGRRPQHIRQALMVVVLANTAIALIQALGGSPLGITSVAGRVAGFFGAPVFLSALLAAGWWLFAHLWAERRQGWVLAVMAAIAGAVQASGSRSSLVILVLGALVFVVVAGRRAGLAALGATVVGLVLATLLVVSVNRLGPSATPSTGVGHLLYGGGYSMRVENWLNGIKSLGAHPIFGSGPGRYLAATSKYTTRRQAIQGAPDTLYADAHDIFVEYLVTSGIPGFLLFAAFLGAAIALAGWRSPLAGFGLILLAGHLLEPQTTVLTPLAFLALGAAGARVEAVVVPRISLVPALAASFACWLVVAIGTWDLTAVTGRTTVSVAVRELRTARTLLFAWPDAYTESGVLYNRLAAVVGGDVAAQALKFFVQAVDRDPADPTAWYNLGRQQLALGMSSEARRSFEHGLSENPQSVMLRDALGRLAARAGDLATARSLYHQALDLDPHDEVAKAGLAAVGPGGRTR